MRLLLSRGVPLFHGGGSFRGSLPDISKVSAECYKRSMIRIGVPLSSVLSSFLFALQVSAQDLPIFDTHIHYNRPDWSVHPPELSTALGRRGDVS